MFWCVRDAFPNHLGAENQAGAARLASRQQFALALTSSFAAVGHVWGWDEAVWSILMTRGN
jgi:hypothetical protein